jgi:hypothetical protein
MTELDERWEPAQDSREPLIPQWTAVGSLRRTYPWFHTSMQEVIAQASETIELPNVTDIEVHADRLRLSSSIRGGAVAEIPFDMTGMTPRGGVFDFVLDHDRQTVFLLSGQDDALSRAAKQRLLDILRPHYWLIEGDMEPGANLLLLGMPGIRRFLTDILDRADLGMVHPWIRAAVRAVDRDEGAGASEFAQNIQRASIELRRNDLDPGLQKSLDDAAQVAVRLRRGVQPVLAIRRVSRYAILRSIGADGADALQRAFAEPGSVQIASAHAMGADFVANTDTDGLLALAEELRECEFFAIFLADRLSPARHGGKSAVTGRDGAPVPVVVAPHSLRESTKLVHSLSRANAFLFSREASRRMGREVHDFLPNPGRGRRIAGFFPGLGSRIFYQHLGRGLLDCAVSEVAEIYEEGARALGFPGQPERLVMTAQNIPAGRSSAQGFIGAALLVHSLALEAHLRATAAAAGVPVGFVAYTGESFGIITAAVAGGALSVADGVKLGHAFTPLMLAAADGVAPDDPLAARMAAYLPASLRGRRLVPEPYHVVGLRGDPADLGEMLAGIARTFPKNDVEVHKLYSRRQTNVYVRAGAKDDFDRFAEKFPAVGSEELKAPTTFLAHAARMTGVRQAFERFMQDNGIVFRKPHTPVVSNNNSGLLTTAAEVRNGILAITDEIMASQTAAETLDSLRPDAIVELGLGNKSVQLLIDNDVDVPVTSYAGIAEDCGPLLSAVILMDRMLGELENLHAQGDLLADRHYHTLREIFRLSEADPFCKRYIHRTIRRVLAHEMLHRDRAASWAFREFLEIYQHTYNYGGHVDVRAGELVLRARLKKRLVGHADEIGRAYAELKVIDGAGLASDRLDASGQHEVVVFHFDQLPGLDYADLARNTRLLLDTQPLAHQIYDHVLERLGIDDDSFLTLTGVTAPTVDQLALSYLLYQYTLFHLLRLHRPVVFMHGYYIAGSGPMGWLVALAVSDAAPLPDLVRLYCAYLRSGMEAGETKAALDRVLASLQTPDVPLISPHGTPVQAKIDLEVTTRAVFHPQRP